MSASMPGLEYTGKPKAIVKFILGHHQRVISRDKPRKIAYYVSTYSNLMKLTRSLRNHGRW
jgi:hypothetical protein